MILAKHLNCSWLATSPILNFYIIDPEYENHCKELFDCDF